MRIENKYKITEVGVIPEDWEVKELGEFCTKVGSGITPTGGEKVYKPEGRPFLRSQNIGWGKLLLEDIAFIDDITHEKFNSTEIEKDDVFLNITGASIGRSSIADDRVVAGNVNQHVCIIRTKKSLLMPLFLNYFLLSFNGQKQIESYQSGGNRQGLNFGQIRSFKILLPPTINEQVAIATAISDIDELIQTLEKLIDKKRVIKQGAMQELLTGKKRVNEFGLKAGKYKKTEIGIVPEDWHVYQIGDLIKFLGGSQPDRTYFISTRKEGYIRLIQIRDYKTDKYKTYIPISLARRFCSKEDIMIGRYGPPIFQILSGLDGAYNVALIKAIPSEKLNKIYAYYYLKQEKLFDFIEKLSQRSSGQTGVDLKELRSYPLLLPPTIEEQKAIASILSDMDAEITALENKLEKYKKIKQGMMQNLLTGKIRLI
ncbi:MAG TPA: restriction endonuclease subunit S [Pseudobacteroides sp.]|uniref:restriction endonuclease subunit S n=1 Tax=Pseudobacteroides sp. TaxID=1968840 RepID=UPI002F95710B